MCGICFILGGAPIEKHNFEDFNFFNSYVRNNNVKLNKHIIENKLMLPNCFEPQRAKDIISNRGPDHIAVSTVDMFKIVPEPIDVSKLEENMVPLEEKAISFQSVLHLRGDDMYVSKQPGSHFLYNGEIWDTGNLKPIGENQNDGEWMH